MEWFVDEPQRGQALLGAISLGIAAIGIWMGRRRLLIAVPCVLFFLLLAAISIPSAIPARTASMRMACIANLRAIADAKTQWARENSKQPTDTPTDADLYGKTKPLRRKPECPRGGNYLTGDVKDNPTCSFADKGHRL